MSRVESKSAPERPPHRFCVVLPLVVKDRRRTRVGGSDRRGRPIACRRSCGHLATEGFETCRPAWRRALSGASQDLNARRREPASRELGSIIITIIHTPGSRAHEPEEVAVDTASGMACMDLDANEGVGRGCECECESSSRQVLYCIRYSCTIPSSPSSSSSSRRSSA